MALAQTVAVMDRGRLVQAADPKRLYREPGTPMVAGFIGKGTVVDAEVLEPSGDGRCAARVFGATATLRCAPGQPAGPARACLRPEELALDASGVAAAVRRVTYKGGSSEIEVTPQADPRAVLVLNVVGDAPRQGSEVRVRVVDGWVIPRAAPARGS
jgi:iron(III) transport system ATP-binding protein